MGDWEGGRLLLLGIPKENSGVIHLSMDKGGPGAEALGRPGALGEVEEIEGVTP